MDEREKVAVTAMLEDFKALSLEQVHLQNEVNKWSTLYSAAVTVSISWVLNNQRYQGSNSLEVMFSKDQGANPYLLLSLALINAMYILSMTFKGYEIQEIRLYLCEVIGQRIMSITGEPFNLVSEWRRVAMQTARRAGKLEPIRTIYYFLVSLLPFGVSVTILGLYMNFQWRDHRWWGGHNLFFYAVVAINLTVFYVSLWTTRTGRKWKRLVQNRSDNDRVNQYIQPFPSALPPSVARFLARSRHGWAKLPNRSRELVIAADRYLRSFASGGMRHAADQSQELASSQHAAAAVQPPQLTACKFDQISLNENGKRILECKGSAKYFSERIRSDIAIQMVSIREGSFLMGSPETEIGREVCEGPQHRVTVPQFFMSMFEVTQAQWREVAYLPQVRRKLHPFPSLFKGGHLPVENVSWEEAKEFCYRLSNKTGRHYRLPTEAEWEYACRAATHTPFHFGPGISADYVNCKCGSSERGRTIGVGGIGVANAFGLFDMHGNVSEWCIDIWHDDYTGAPEDGTAWLGEGARSVVRGGSWKDEALCCRSASRQGMDSDSKACTVGFRVVMTEQ